MKLCRLMKYRVVIVEDNKPLADGFAEVINKTDNFKVISIYTDGNDAVKNIKRDEADIYLMDIELPGINGVEVTKSIKELRSKTNILMVTVHENSDTVFDALCAGASGYLSKNASRFELVTSLDEVLEGGAPMSINIAKMVVNSFRKSTSSILSERETEVLTQLASGKSYNSVAQALFISVNTIRFHVKNIYEKLQVNTKEEAIAKANKDRII